MHLINTSNQNWIPSTYYRKRVDETKTVNKSHIPDREWEAVELYVCEYTYKQLNISNWLQKKCITQKTIAKNSTPPLSFVRPQIGNRTWYTTYTTTTTTTLYITLLIKYFILEIYEHTQKHINAIEKDGIFDRGKTKRNRLLQKSQKNSYVLNKVSKMNELKTVGHVCFLNLADTSHFLCFF